MGGQEVPEPEREGMQEHGLAACGDARWSTGQKRHATVGGVYRVPVVDTVKAQWT